MAMNNQKFLLLLLPLGALALLGVVVVFGRVLGGQVKTAPVHTFAECVAQGNPVMESYPRQCRAGNITFVENVMPAIQPDPVVLDTGFAQSVVTSPLTITGKALGTWFFEASFPVSVTDANGVVLGTGVAQAQAEWMTTDYVPFQVVVTFTPSSTQTGYVEFKKDNPSGLPEHDATVRIPVRFE